MTEKPALRHLTFADTPYPTDPSEATARKGSRKAIISCHTGSRHLDMTDSSGQDTRKQNPIMERTSKLCTNEHNRSTSAIHHKQTLWDHLSALLPVVYGLVGALRMRRKDYGVEISRSD